MTKKLRKDRVRELLDGYPMHAPLTAIDLDTLSDLIQVTGIVKAWKQPNPRYPHDTRHLYLLFDGQSPEEADAWSWIKAIDQPNPDTQMKKVLRDAVSLDLSAFMNAQYDPACQRCGAVYRLTVDHVDPSFDTIATDFMMSMGDIELDRADDGVGNVIKDPDIAAHWRQYHADRSVYQILCVSCNASKGAR